MGEEYRHKSTRCGAEACNGDLLRGLAPGRRKSEKDCSGGDATVAEVRHCVRFDQAGLAASFTATPIGQLMQNVEALMR